jgi:hypothetical protein
VGAYNWIDFEGNCLHCGETGPIRCQTHVAATYSGDETGMFHGRTYRVGERMAWWPDRQDWRDSFYAVSQLDPSEVEEACIGHCGSCGSELCVVIRFRDRAPVEIRAISRGSAWPRGYP